MANPKIQLACDIIQDEFEQTVKTVCQVLMERTSATLDELVRVTGLDKGLVRESLIVGIQHNFVVGMEQEREGTKAGGGKNVLTTYHLILENVLVRVRFPAYIVQAKEKFGDYAEQIVMAILKEGRATVQTLLALPLEEGLPDYSHQCVLDSVKVLKDNKYLMEVPKANTESTLPCRSSSRPLTTGDEDDDTPLARGRKRSSSGTVITKKTGSEKDGTTSTAKRTAKAPVRAKKSSSNAKKTAMLSVAPELRIYDNDDDGAAPSFSSAMQMDDFPIEPLVPPTTNSSITATSIHLEHDETRYCLDYDRFNREFAKDACIAFVGEKIDLNAAGIFREMFEVSETSRLVSEERLHFNLTNPERPSYDRSLAALPKARLLHYLDLMSKDRTQMLTKHSNGYSINHKSILTMVKQKMIESVVLDKFGGDSLRIFRLLLLKNLLEQKQVSELAMTPIKETRDCLYKMLQHHFVHLQEVPRTSEHIPSKTFYLWCVRLPHVQKTLINDMYKAMRNMRLRLSHTLVSHQDLYAKREEEERILLHNPKYSLLTDAEHAQLADLQIVQERLEVSVIHLDASIRILEDY
jgi:DNA-directed RNA polymerase III subunit RPC3